MGPCLGDLAGVSVYDTVISLFRSLKFCLKGVSFWNKFWTGVTFSKNKSYEVYLRPSVVTVPSFFFLRCIVNRLKT